MFAFPLELFLSVLTQIDMGATFKMLDILFVVRARGGAVGRKRQDATAVNHAVTNIKFPTECGRVVEGLSADMTSMELRQMNMFCFPVVIDLLESAPLERPHVRKVLVASLSFLARLATLPSFEFNDVTKPKIVYALKKWREAFKEVAGQAYIGVNEVSA